MALKNNGHSGRYWKKKLTSGSSKLPISSDLINLHLEKKTCQIGKKI